MQLVEGRVVVSPSDLTGFLACEHLTAQERLATAGTLSRPDRVDPELDILTRRGQEHELAYLEVLQGGGRDVLRLDLESEKLNRQTLAGLTAAHEQTVAAIQHGPDVIYQAAFFDGRWVGYADFLLRTDRPSDLGAFSYEVADTKLARRVKAAALLQMCSYAEQLERIQGVTSEQLHVIVGDRTDQSYRLADFAAYYRAVKKRFEDSLANGFGATYPTPVEHCKVCRWALVCEARRRADDHLSLVAGLGRDQARKLAAVEIRTVADLAKSTLIRVPKIGEATFERLRHQAALQVIERETSAVTSEMLPPEQGRGLALLPLKSPGDLFFDMESDPWAEDGGLEYLFGVVEVNEGAPRFHAFWGLDRAGEKKAFEDFIDFVMARRLLDPNLHVYHYAGYEVTALKRLMGRHSTREDEIDSLLRDGVLVDLFQVVRQGVRVSQESYSLKKLEPLYMGGREADIKGGLASIVAFEQWLESRDQAILDAIGEYNREDCESTWRLRGWLEEQRAKAELQFGAPIGRPGPIESEVPAERAADDATTAQLVDALTTGSPEIASDRSPQRAQWLLAELLRWHRRDAKPAWWDYYHRFTMSDDELFDDGESIAGLKPTGEVIDVKNSSVKTYRFDPSQEHKLSAGKEVFDPATRKYAGKIEDLDPAAGILKLKKKRDDAPLPTSIVPRGPINTDVLRDAVRRLAGWVVEYGIDAPGRGQAARDLLLGRPPRIKGLAAGALIVTDGDDASEVARRVAPLLLDTVLPIQGPPGSGKTYTGARMIVDLLRAGQTVAVAAYTHKAITNLLNAVCERAAAESVMFKGVQRGSPDDCCDSPLISIAKGNEDVVKALGDGATLVAGTQFLFARPEMAEQFDVLFVDEAGQLSLANVVAIAGCARSVVLLGDPNQLAQPSQGTHPPGVGVSALEHLLGAHQTIPPDRGIFLSVTRRLHPDICAFTSEVFYEGRLVSEASCAVQLLEAAGEGTLGGTGLRYFPVVHSGNRTTSSEEIDVVDREYRALLRRPWVDRSGIRRAVTPSDILVVAPYNVHVNRLRDRLPAGSRVGTVDRFQGQEAAVVFFSMATSGADDIPRNMEFLYSLNRLNVAVSRALVLAVLVCSPNLLAVRCRNPEQMRLANALCRFTELAAPAVTNSARLS